MERTKNIFRINFHQDEMNFIDGMLAIIFYFFYMALIYLFGLLKLKTDLYFNLSQYFTNKYFYKFLFYIPLTIISIAPIIITVYIRKQSLSTLGFIRTNTLKSILLGVLFALPFTSIDIIYGITHNYRLINMEDALWTFLYFLICIAFVEELTFRGFIQTRIRGIIKNKWLSIIIVGLMFAIMHIPFQMLKAKLPLIPFIQMDLGHLISTSILHIYFVYIYTRHNNIIAPTIAHALVGFVPYIF